MRPQPHNPRNAQPAPAARERSARPKGPEGPRSFRALLTDLRPLPSPERRLPLRTSSNVAETKEAPVEAKTPAFAHFERSVEPLERRIESRAAGPLPEPPSAQAIELLQVAEEARALRLRLGGRAGWASIEIELRDDDGEISLTIATEDGDRGRAKRWASAIDEALARRGLSGRITAD